MILHRDGWVACYETIAIIAAALQMTICAFCLLSYFWVVVPSTRKVEEEELALGISA